MIILKGQMLIKVRSEDNKRTIFRQLHKLRDNKDFPGIGMSHDMTKEEKEQTRLLVSEAKKKSKELSDNLDLDSDSKNWVFLLRGPPWKQHIVQVRPRRPLF